MTAVRGREVNLENPGDVRGQGSLAREYTITYRDHLEANEEVVQGNSGQRAGSRRGRVDVRGLDRAEHPPAFNINVGDEMRFDVVGRADHRESDECPPRRMGPVARRRLHVRFPPGCPGGCAAHVRRIPERPFGSCRARPPAVPPGVALPNVHAIDGREILARIQSVVDNAVLGISIVGGVALLSGTLILIGAVAMTKFQRVYEAAILRTLGASTGAC